MGCPTWRNCSPLDVINFFFSHFVLSSSFSLIPKKNRLRLLGRTPSSSVEYQLEENPAEKGAEEEEHAEGEEPKSAESDRSTRGVYYNGYSQEIQT
jgi:hypothetical protein